MHRYIPVIAKWSGFDKITEKAVVHYARKHGVSKFGLERFIFGFLDLFSITFMGKYGKRPMHFFGSLGTLMFLISFLFLIYIGVDKLFLNKGAKLIANRTEFYVALTALILGVQLFLAGFLGEMNMNEKTELFVNLRCAELQGNRVVVYVGGGVTVGSIPKKEWEETFAKTQTIKKVL